MPPARAALPDLVAATRAARLPFLPGVQTVSEAPAEPAGGLAWLTAVAAPLAGLRICPTGGIGADTARAYLALHNVACVGGSWMAPAAAVDARDRSQIEWLAAAASKHKRS